MAKNITEKVIQLITQDNQLISVVEDQGFLPHLETLLYTDSIFQLQHAGMHTSFVGLIQDSM